MSLEIRSGWPDGSDLVRAYLAGEPAAVRLYGGHFSDPATYLARAEALDRRFDRARRDAAVPALRGGGTGGAERLSRWAEEGGLVVTTGQQAGLFTGPLYTIHKAVTAIRLAGALESLLERPVLPVFWIASEDHDWEEAARASVVDLDNELREIRIPPPDPERAPPLHRIPLGRAGPAAVEEIAGLLPETEFTPDLLALLRQTLEPDATLPSAMGRVLEALLGPHGLFVTDAHHPAVKVASREVLRREVEEAEEREEALRARARRLEREGHPLQVPVLEDALNLFVEGPAGRERLFRDGDGFRLRRSQSRMERSELLRRIEEEPATVSPNVLLRPVAESAAFPVAAYVGGPGEIAYFAELEPVFGAHGMEPPPVHPRRSFTLVEGKVAKVLEKFGLSPAELQAPPHEIAGRLAREEVPDEVRRALGELRGAIGEGSGRLLEAVRTLDPTLKGPVDGARNTAFQALDEVEAKIVQAVKREDRIAASQVEKARVHLFPGGRPQERVLNVFYYLARYGPDLVERLIEEAAVEFASPAV